MSTLCDGDLITLYLDHDSDETGDGFLGSDNGETQYSHIINALAK